MRRALDDADIVAPLQRAAAVDVIAAGKAAAVMLNARFVDGRADATRARHWSASSGAAAGSRRMAQRRSPAPWPAASPPRGARSRSRRRPDLTICSSLLSGGGSALMTLPADGISLADKQQTARTLMERSADIYELNTVRKHLSARQLARCGERNRADPGRLGRRWRRPVRDRVGSDGSDDSTYAQALAILDAWGRVAAYPAAVVERLRRRADGALPETPQTGDTRLGRSMARVIGPQRAIEGAEVAAR